MEALLAALESAEFAFFMCIAPIGLYAAAVLGPYLGTGFAVVSLTALALFGWP